MRQRTEAFSEVKYPYMNYCLLVECLRDAMSYHDMHLLCSIQSDIFNLFWKIAYFVSANICYSYFWWQAQLKKKHCTIFAIHPSIITHKIILWKIQPERRWFTKYYLFQTHTHGKMLFKKYFYWINLNENINWPISFKCFETLNYHDIQWEFLI